MKAIFKTDISKIDGYSSAGMWWKKVYADDEKHIYLFQAREDLYEMMVGRKAKQPDGTYVYRKPSSDEWGAYGWTFWGDKETCLKKFIEKYCYLVARMPQMKEILLEVDNYTAEGK